jgi:hypothetical protein
MALISRCLALALVLAPSLLLAHASDAFFPAGVFFPDNKELNEIIERQEASQLRVKREPSLWKTSRDDQTAVAYRLLWVPSFTHSVCVRVWKDRSKYRLHAIQHDPRPGKTEIIKDTEISAALWEQLVGSLDRAGFWTAPTSTKEDCGFADGDSILIEGIRDGRYHVTSRIGSVCREGYRTFSRLLLDASASGRLGEWDARREADRKDPTYRDNPTETEDRGTREPCDSVRNELSVPPS